MRYAVLASGTEVGIEFASIGFKLDFYRQFHWQSALFFDTNCSLSIIQKERRGSESTNTILNLAPF
jgi:hypothetical protein